MLGDSQIAKLTKAAAWAQQGARNDSVLSQDEGMAAQKDAALTLTSLHVGKVRYPCASFDLCITANFWRRREVVCCLAIQRVLPPE